MDDLQKKVNREQIEAEKGEKIPLADEELDQVTGGAEFLKYGEKKRP